MLYGIAWKYHGSTPKNDHHFIISSIQCAIVGYLRVSITRLVPLSNSPVLMVEHGQSQILKGQGCQGSGNSLGGKSHRAMDSQIRVRRSKEWFNQGLHLAHNETRSPGRCDDGKIFPPRSQYVMSLLAVIFLIPLLPHGIPMFAFIIAAPTDAFPLS